MATKSFADKVKSFLKGGDERKINSFHSKVITSYKDNIELLERKNKNLQEELGEAKEAKVDFTFNIDLDRLKSIDERIKYAKEYGQALLEYDAENIIPLEEQIEENKEKIKILKETIKFLETVEPVLEEE